MTRAENFRWWIEALRSGRFQQEQRQLRSLNGSAHCCLGVCGTKLVEDRPEEFAWVTLTDAGHEDHQELVWLEAEDHDYALLPMRAAEIFGFVEYAEQSKFVVLNDELNLSFAKIADVVEYLVDNDLRLHDLWGYWELDDDQLGYDSDSDI